MSSFILQNGKLSLIWSRKFVESDGSIHFSKYHATEPHTEAV